VVVRQPPLFYRANIFDVLASRHAVLEDDFKRLPETALSDDQLPEKLANKYGLAVPILDDANKHATTREVDVDVSRDPMRVIFDPSRPVYVRGTEITIHIPFQGDPSLFDVRPQNFNLNPPRGEFDEHELRMIYTIIEPKDISPEIERRITEVKQHLDWLRPSAVQLKSQLQQLVQALVAERNKRIKANEQLIKNLGIPIRQATPAASTKPPEFAASTIQRKARVEGKSSSQWDFFISHASEDKEEIARPLADALVAKGYKVWYDDFSLKLGDILLESIDRGLAGSSFGIVILSPHFFEKHWPQQELSGLATREENGKKVILPVWHKVGLEEVRSNSPTLAGRLGVLTDRGLDHVVAKILDAVG
jgi:hypothetical protein